MRVKIVNRGTKLTARNELAHATKVTTSTDCIEYSVTTSFIFTYKGSSLIVSVPMRLFIKQIT